jgi:hypothetical protein
VRNGLVVVAVIALLPGLVVLAVLEDPDAGFLRLCEGDGGASRGVCQCVANELRTRHGYEGSDLESAIGHWGTDRQGDRRFVYERTPEYLHSRRSCENREELRAEARRLRANAGGTVRAWLAAAREGDAEALCDGVLATDRFIRTYDGEAHRRPCARLEALSSTSRTPLDDTLDEVFPEEKRARARERAEARARERAIGKGMADRSIPRGDAVSVDAIAFDVEGGGRVERSGEITYAKTARVEASAKGRRLGVTLVRDAPLLEWKIDRLSRRGEQP